MTRTQHQAVMYPLNPIIAPGPSEYGGLLMPFSGGAWFDPSDQLFKIWLFCGAAPVAEVCYEYSMDGKNWIRPAIPDAFVPNTNQVIPSGLVVWMNLQNPDPNNPLQALANGVGGGNGVYAYGSTSSFPGNTYNFTNYWVDVVFTQGGAPPPSCPCTIWSGTSVPALADAGPDSPVELGVKFTANVNGTISGIRFYKSSANTGTHVGNLWTSTGTLLATAIFTNETASGWQQVSFPTPVAITANTTYVASYHTRVGHYSADQTFFAHKFTAFTVLPAPQVTPPILASFSTDGIHWLGTNQNQYPIPIVYDRTTLFWNPFRNVWVDSMKNYMTLPSAPTRPGYLSRFRNYAESPDLMNWTPVEPVNFGTSFWTGPDVNDPPYVPGETTFPQLYNLDAVGYESVMVGLFS